MPGRDLSPNRLVKEHRECCSGCWSSSFLDFVVVPMGAAFRPTRGKVDENCGQVQENRASRLAEEGGREIDIFLACWKERLRTKVSQEMIAG